MPDVQPAKQRRGCLFYGCITASVLALLLLICGFFVYRFAQSKLQEIVSDYTTSAPTPLPKSEMPPAQVRSLRERVEQFSGALEKGEASELVLTADEINALIENEPDLEELRGKVYLMIEEDRIQSRVSYPLDQLNLKQLRGRYVNGTADLKVSLQNGVLVVKIVALDMNGKQLPAQVMNMIRQENLAKEVTKDPEKAKTLEKFERLEVRDGKVFITSKSAR